MSTPLAGHLDPSFVDIMDDVQELSRHTFRTDNEWTTPVSGTGSASLEAAIVNLTEPGDTVLVPRNGYFEERMASMVGRAGGEPVFVDASWGEPLDPEDDRWLPSLDAVRLPDGVDDGAVISQLLDEHGIEVASGVGDLAGEIVRVGCMGHSAKPGNALTLVAALGDALESVGAGVDADAGLAAARCRLAD
jgi:aspartate aminotransferase-like enzyme